MKVISKVEAKRLGLSRFYLGKPCKHGHDSERLVANYTCVQCDRVRYRQCAPRLAAEQGIRRVEKHYKNARVSGTTLDDFLPIYERAAHMTTSTGTQHEVDHIVPLAQGGKHSPTNLQVIERSANRQKAKSSLPYIRRLEDRVKELERQVALLSQVNNRITP